MRLSLAVATTTTAAATAAATTAHAWPVAQFNRLLVFGDSYSDQGRLAYFAAHNGSAPPPGTAPPDAAANADGGRVWPQYVGQYAAGLRVTNYATSGAACSNGVTPRFDAALGSDWPSVAEYQIPAYEADEAAEGTEECGRGLYAVFIGTNDLGVRALIEDEEVRGLGLAAYVDCVFAGLERLYARGARWFVVFGLIDLYEAPLYANASAHGVAASAQYWPHKPSNTTAVSEKMRQYVQTTNALYRYRTAYEALLGGKFEGARFALFDTERLFRDIYERPDDFLNGTQKPYNTSDWETSHANVSSPDSFMWYDELHPSEQTERWIAKSFLEVVQGVSKYGMYIN